MVRPRTLVRLLPAAALSLSLPLAHQDRDPVAAAAPAQTRAALLRVPPAMLHDAAVPVIVQLDTGSAGTTQALLASSPQLQSLLAGVRDRLMTALRGVHAQNVHAFHIIPAVAATVPGSALPSLLKEPGVRAITLDNWHALPAASATTSTGSLSAGAVAVAGPQTVEPESLALTRADVAQAYGYNGAGVRVAVIDSGLDLNQPDLAGVAALDAQGRPLRVDYTGTGLRDTVGHGTACASMIAAQGRTLYSSDTGYTSLDHTPGQIYPIQTGSTIYRSRFHVHGMAPGVRIMSAKIFDRNAPHGGGFESWIVRGIEWAIDNHADVISESFGGLAVPSNGTDPTALADEAAIRAGITVVAADGNEGPGQTTISSPANAEGVIAVGASTDYRSFGQTGFLAGYGHTIADNIASFTSRGPTTDGRPRPDLVAPGAFTWALFPQNKSDDGPTHRPYNVGTFGGTSQATPVTAGAAALVVGAYEKTHNGTRPTPAMVRSILMSSAHDLGFPAFDQGAGRLDAWKAVQTATHAGPSFLLGPNSLAVAGPVAAPFSRTFSITNSGPTTRDYHFSAVQSRQAGQQEWSGKLGGKELKVYHFTVRPGLERIVGAVYWNSAGRFLVAGVSKEVALRVSLYDPLGRFANYSYGVGSGYASTQASRPMPGKWTLVVTQNGRKDNGNRRHFIDNEGFQAGLSAYVSAPYGSLSPSSVVLAPGRAARVTLSGHTPFGAGTQEATIHVAGDHTAAIPVALTSYITFNGNAGPFNGVFSGPSNGYFSLANENKTYSFNVPAGTRTLNVALSWPNQGYGVVLLLLDPSNEIVDGQFNGVSNGSGSGPGSATSPFDLSSHSLEAIWSHPKAGRWQVVVMDAVFAGKQVDESFGGRVTLNETPVTPVALAKTVLPGANFDLGLNVRNNNGPNVAEGYIGYATTDSYSLVPLGEIHGPFGPARSGGGSVYTFRTGFVPPATRTVVAQFAAARPNVPVDLSFADPIGFARAQGQSAPVKIDGQTYSGSTATVSGAELPIGAWNGEVTLQRPADAGTRGLIIGKSYADALTPLSWVTFDHGLQNGRITGGQPLVLLPGQQDQLHAHVTVPLDATPGAHRVRLFVYSVFGDQVADETLTITVRPHTGSEPAAAKP